MGSKLAQVLYIFCTIMSTSYNFLFSFIPIILQISEYRNDTCSLRLFSLQSFSCKKVLNDKLQSQLVKMVLINASSIAFMCVLFCSIQFIKSRRNIRINYQQNIVTFNQNFFFYIVYSIINLILTMVRMYVLDFSSNIETLERIVIFSYLIKLCFAWLLRPLITLILLRKNMPEFFEDFEETIKEFTFIGQAAPHPRSQRFLTYKPFSQNARWGSQKKFMTINTVLVNQQRKYLVQSNSLPQTIVSIPDVYF